MSFASVDHTDEKLEASWVKSECASVFYDDVPVRTIQAAPVPKKNQTSLASPPARYHGLGLIGGNTSALVQGNPQDVESELRGLTRPITKVNERAYKPSVDKTHIAIHNFKHNMSIDTRSEMAPTYQLWAYPATYAPQPFVKETCGAPHRF